ncbi:MAG: hypothetical protein RSB82_04400 [Victivallaceae bacterium]
MAFPTESGTGSSPFVKQLDNEATSANVFSEFAIKRLKALGITRLVIGLLLIVAGLATALSLANPLMLLIVAGGLVLICSCRNFIGKSHKTKGGA